LGDYEIYAIKPDGSGLTEVTKSWADDLAPVWSPDGRWIAFVSLRDTLTGKWDLEKGSIYITEFDLVRGVSLGNVRRVTDNTASDGWPTWSPDGQRIAFHSKRDGNWDIWVINIDGTGLTRLTRHDAPDRYPAWSPDGRQIAFTSKRSGNEEIWVLDFDAALSGEGDSQAVNLTQSPSPDRYSMWSPDGRQLAFTTRRDGNYEVYLMGADGSNPRNVSNSPDTTEGLADWSPDGKSLVLYSNRPGNKDVFIVDLAASHWTNITKHPASDEFCTWSP
jgi:TolB protein